jgi:hypothetical protein
MKLIQKTSPNLTRKCNAFGKEICAVLGTPYFFAVSLKTFTIGPSDTFDHGYRIVLVDGTGLVRKGTSFCSRHQAVMVE